MTMNCICCGKSFKYGWQLKENVGICEECLNPIEIYLSTADVDLNDLKNTKTFEEAKNKLITTLSVEKDKETIEYLTSVLDRIYSVSTSNTTDNQNISPINHNNNINIPIVSVSNSNTTGMFGNIGGKIKSLAKIATWLGIIVSVIWGFVLMTTNEDLIPAGLIVALLGSLISWISSFVLYGFGQLIENTDKLVESPKK